MILISVVCIVNIKYCKKIKNKSFLTSDLSKFNRVIGCSIDDISIELFLEQYSILNL